MFSVILVLIGGMAYALGRSDIAKSSWAWAVVVAAATAWALGHGGAGGAAGLEAKLVCPPRSVYTDLPVYVVVTGPPGSYTVDWGDGSTSVCTIASGNYYCAVSHVYAEPGSYTVSSSASGSCSVSAVSLGDALQRALEEAAPHDCGWSFWDLGTWMCHLEEKGLTLFGKVYGALMNYVAGVVGQGGGALDRLAMGLITVPETVRVYDAAHAAALQWLGYAVVIAAVWRAFWEFEKGLSWLDALREIAFAGLALALVPDFYAAAARAVNSIAIAIGQPGQALSLLVSLLTMAVLWAVLPLPGAGGFAALIAGGAGMLGLVSLLKYLTVWGIMSVYPLIVLLWLIPFTRSVARTMAMTVIGIMAWSLVLAGITGALATVLADPMGMSPLEAVVVSLATPAVMLLSGVGVLGGVFNLPVPGAGIAQNIIGGIAAKLGLQRATPQAAMLAAPGAVIGHTEYLRPQMPMAATPAPAGAWQPAVWSGTGMAITVPSPTATSHARTTEWLRPAAGPAAAGVRPVEGGYELRGAEAARSIAKAHAEETARDMGVELERPRPVEEVPPATQRIKEAVKDAVATYTGYKAAKRIAKRELGAIARAVREAEGAKAAAAAGAVAARLHAYMSNRARQFIREFSIAFEKQTGIRVPTKLKEIQPIEWQRIEQRIKTGAEAGATIGQTIYMKIRRPVRLSKAAAGASSATAGFRKYARPGGQES